MKGHLKKLQQSNENDASEWKIQLYDSLDDEASENSCVTLSDHDTNDDSATLRTSTARPGEQSADSASEAHGRTSGLARRARSDC